MEFTFNTGLNFAVLAGIAFQIYHGVRRASREAGAREERDKNQDRHNKEIKEAVKKVTDSHTACRDGLPKEYYPFSAGEKLEICVGKIKDRVGEHDKAIAKLEVRPPC